MQLNKIDRAKIIFVMINIDAQIQSKNVISKKLRYTNTEISNEYLLCTFLINVYKYFYYFHFQLYHSFHLHHEKIDLLFQVK